MAGKLGVLLYGAGGERLKGDPGCPDTYPFPVLLGQVEGSYRDLTGEAEGRAEKAATCLKKAASDLESQGAAAVVGDCGLMALCQGELAEYLSVPVCTSSLILLPFIRAVMGNRPVGILTGHSELLKPCHLRGAGQWEEGGCLIQGMEEEPHFRAAVLEGREKPDRRRMEADTIQAVRKLLARQPDTGAILLECSNLAACSETIREETGLPVFDIHTAVAAIGVALGRRNGYAFFRV